MGGSESKIESLWHTVGGLRVHARASQGDAAAAGGVTVVLVHGLIVSGFYMLPTAVRLAPSYRVLIPDLPGFGKSQKPPRPLDVAGLADALGEWIMTTGISGGAVVLVGNSLGCQVIASLAARRPHLAAGVVLASPTVDAESRTFWQQFWRLLTDAPRERLSLILAELRGLWEAGLVGAWQTTWYALADRIEDNLPHVRAPALVVRGTKDPLCPPAWAERVTRLLPRGRLALVEGAPHALNYTTPDELASLIRQFIESNVRPGAPTVKTAPA